MDWPIDVGGKPWDSLPAFAPVAFEVTVLLAGLATVFGVLVRTARRRGDVGPEELRVTSDRFALVVARPDAAVTDDALEDLWESTGAVQADDHVEEIR